MEYRITVYNDDEVLIDEFVDEFENEDELRMFMDQEIHNYNSQYYGLVYFYSYNCKF